MYYYDATLENKGVSPFATGHLFSTVPSAHYFANSRKTLRPATIS